MELLLLKDVRKLGHVGDVVSVRPGYARNYLLPQLLATFPTPENLAAIEEEKQRAAAERALRNREFEQLVERLSEASVTIEASANPEGTLYGSVGSRDIAEALQAQGFEVLPQHVMLSAPIRSLDNVVVPLEFTDDIATQVKVWVVREGGAIDDEDAGDIDHDPADEPIAGGVDATADDSFDRE
jgi:large subunit ribosomal protein L9